MSLGQSIAIIVIGLAVVFVLIFSDGSNGRGKR